MSAPAFTPDQEPALDFLRRDTLRSCLGPNATKARRAIERGGSALGSGAVSVPQALRAMQMYAERLIASLEQQARGEQ